MQKKTVAFLAAVLTAGMLLTGCGKDKETKATVETLPPPSGMEFIKTNDPVTAKSETNLRNYPSQGSDSTVLYTLKNGEIAQQIAFSNSGWSIVEFEGNTYYAVSSYLTTDLDYKSPDSQQEDDGIQTEFQETNRSVTAKDTVNLRSIPSVTDPASEIIGQLVNGEVAAMIGTSDSGWAKLDYKGTICYAVSSYLTTDLNYQPPKNPSYMDEDGIHTEFEDAEGTVTAKDAVNLRTLPSVTNPEASVITQLKNGETAERIGVSKSGWTKLRYNGKVCYAVSSYLTTDLDGSTGDDDGDGIKTKFTEVNDQVTAKDEVNLRTVPSVTDAESKVIHKLKHGEIVTRTGVNEDVGWSRVEYEGQVLYCVTRYLEMVKP